MPSACATPTLMFMRAVISEATLPMSIWPQAMSKARPSSESALVSPVIACFDAV